MFKTFVCLVEFVGSAMGWRFYSINVFWRFPCRSDCFWAIVW